MGQFKTPEELDTFLDAVTGKIKNLEDRHAAEDGNKDKEISEFDKWFYGHGKQKPKSEPETERATG